jgi:hypothetical protein
VTEIKCKYYARKRGGGVTGGDIHLPSDFVNAEDFPLVDGDTPVAKIDNEGNIVIMLEPKGAWIWTVGEGGLNWIKNQIKSPSSQALYHYAMRRPPKQGEYLVFYANKNFIGRVYVAVGARKITHAEKKENPSLKPFSYEMVLDGNDFEIFTPPIPIESMKNDISVFKGLKPSSLHSKCRFNPRITIDDYNRILEKAEELRKSKK